MSEEKIMVVEDDEELFDLTAARWKLGVEFGKLLLEVWNDARSIGRRVEENAYRDAGKLGLFVRKPLVEVFAAEVSGQRRQFPDLAGRRSPGWRSCTTRRRLSRDSTGTARSSLCPSKARG